MIYLLDSSACIQLLNDKHPVILQHFYRHSPAEIALCSVVKAELLFGAYRSGRIEANLQRLKIFFEPLQSLLFDLISKELQPAPSYWHGCQYPVTWMWIPRA